MFERGGWFRFVRWTSLARIAVSLAYGLGWFVLILTVGSRPWGVSPAEMALWIALGLVLCLGAMLADRQRRRAFRMPSEGLPAITDRRTVRQLRIQRGLAIAGGVAVVILIAIGDREVDARRREIAEIRATGIATVGKVVDRRSERWWVKNDDD